MEFLRGLINPVAVKLGPTATPEQVVDLCARLDPLHVPGRLTLIPRLGHSRVHAVLPRLVAAVLERGHPVVWACDPMHGNLVRTRAGRKTRLIEHILLELSAWMEVHQTEGSWPGGLHLELTTEDVAECLDLGERADAEPVGAYTSLCDPWLSSGHARAVVTQVAAMSPSGGRR